MGKKYDSFATSGLLKGLTADGGLGTWTGYEEGEELQPSLVVAGGVCGRSSVPADYTDSVNWLEDAIDGLLGKDGRPAGFILFADCVWPEPSLNTGTSWSSPGDFDYDPPWGHRWAYQVTLEMPDAEGLLVRLTYNWNKWELPAYWTLQVEGWLGSQTFTLQAAAIDVTLPFRLGVIVDKDNYAQAFIEPYGGGTRIPLGTPVLLCEGAEWWSDTSIVKVGMHSFSDDWTYPEGVWTQENVQYATMGSIDNLSVWFNDLAGGDDGAAGSTAPVLNFTLTGYTYRYNRDTAHEATEHEQNSGEEAWEDYNGGWVYAMVACGYITHHIHRYRYGPKGGLWYAVLEYRNWPENTLYTFDVPEPVVWPNFWARNYRISGTVIDGYPVVTSFEWVGDAWNYVGGQTALEGGGFTGGGFGDGPFDGGDGSTTDVVVPYRPHQEWPRPRRPRANDPLVGRNRVRVSVAVPAGGTAGMAFGGYRIEVSGTGATRTVTLNGVSIGTVAWPDDAARTLDITISVDSGGGPNGTVTIRVSDAAPEAEAVWVNDGWYYEPPIAMTTLLSGALTETQYGFVALLVGRAVAGVTFSNFAFDVEPGSELADDAPTPGTVWEAA